MSRAISNGILVLIASSLVAAVLGSIHAFSVLLVPLEAIFGIARATASLTYSLALVCLTTLVLIGPALYARFKPATIFMSVSVIGASGAMLAGVADTIIVVWIGYGFMFGAANGLGYGFGLQFAARANPGFPGLAMGVVTAAYALGAALSPYGFQRALEFGGFPSTMFSLAIMILATGIIAALLIYRSNARYAEAGAESNPGTLNSQHVTLIWISYGTAVFAGLMVIGHAASLAVAAGFTGWVAPASLAAFNLLGSLLSGWLVDRISKRLLLTILPLTGAMSLAALAVLPELTLALLCVVGFTYGGIIAAYPAAILQQFPAEAGPRAYGRVFTAWGAAGLLAPWAAGKIFDQTGTYEAALWIACLLSIVSALVTRISITSQPGVQPMSRGI